MNKPHRPGFVGAYPEPIPDACYDASNAQGEEFYDEWTDRNEALAAESMRQAEEARKDPASTCGDAFSPATPTDVDDCFREIYEPAHDQMIRDLIAKYDCGPGGSGGKPGGSPAKAEAKSSSSNALLYGLGALALAGIGAAVYYTRYANNPVADNKAAFEGWTCVSGPSELVDWLVDASKEVDYDEWAENVDVDTSPLEQWQIDLLPTDWSVTFLRTRLPTGQEAWVMQHSGIEHLFMRPGVEYDLNEAAEKAVAEYWDLLIGPAGEVPRT
jgi:hypothetical protein